MHVKCGQRLKRENKVGNYKNKFFPDTRKMIRQENMK